MYYSYSNLIHGDPKSKCLCYTLLNKEPATIFMHASELPKNVSLRR